MIVVEEINTKKVEISVVTCAFLVMVYSMKLSVKVGLVAATVI